MSDNKNEVGSGRGTPQMGQCQREKYWEERTDAEKIQALREAVAWMARDLLAANEALAKLGQHSHREIDGQLMTPLHVTGGAHNLNGGSYVPDYARLLKTPRERGNG